MNCKKVIYNIQEQLERYIVKSEETRKVKSLIVGVSGGIDSALVCALVKPVCDKMEIPLIGRSISIESNKLEEIERAKLVGEAFCHNFKEINLSELFDIFIRKLEAYTECGFHKLESDDGLREHTIMIRKTSNEVKIRLGNIKARMRMITLYDIASKCNGMVLSTDNLTEYLLGFSTIMGDWGDFGLIQNIWKTEIYQLVQFFIDQFKFNNKIEQANALSKTFFAIPTDGLGITNSDLDQLQAKSYEEVDKILKTWLTEDRDSFIYDDFLKYENRIEDYLKFKEYQDTLRDNPIVVRYINNEFKRKWPINILRATLEK